MIVYGSTNLTLTGLRGQFYCPRCGKSAAFSEKKVRRFFTLYFIPVIPLQIVETYILCDQCRGRYTAEALNLTRADYERRLQDAFAQTLLRAMVLIMIADGTVDDAEVSEVRRLFSANAASQTLSDEDVRRQVALALRANTTAAEFLQRAAIHLNGEQKDEIIRCCFLVSTAADELREAQMEQLREFPALLGVEESRFRDIISAAS